MFGTSRYAVHMWANGGRIADRHIQRLDRLEGIIRDFEIDYVLCGMPDPDLPERLYESAMRDLVRKRLFMQQASALGGHSVVDQFRRESTPSTPTWGAPFAPEELVGVHR